MPIKGLTGRVRTPRSCRVRLGYKKWGAKYPSDTDVFVGKPVDGITEEIRAAYDGTRIADAGEEVWRLGAELRMMLPWEYDATHEGREIALELLNRSWGQTKLRCSGDGGDEPGQAVVRDDAYLRAIVKVTGEQPEDLGDGRWRVICLGPKCPLWHTNATEDYKLPACHRQMRLQAILLHPATDQRDAGYMKQIGWVEVATGSWNGAIDVQSGFEMIRSLVGRTAWVPFYLRRVARTVIADGRRTVKATLQVGYDADEVLRFGLGPPARAMLRPEVRRELLELAAAEAQFEAVADIVPRPPQAALEAPAAAASRSLSPRGGVGAGDRDQVVEEAVLGHEAEPVEAVRFLTQSERDELKRLCGGTPGDSESLGRFWSLVEMALVAVGVVTEEGELVEYQGAGGQRPRLSLLTTRHRDWIRHHLESESADHDFDQDPDDDEAHQVQGEFMPRSA